MALIVFLSNFSWLFTLISDVRDRRMFTPLHCASQSGNNDVVVTLTKAGADPNCRGFAGTTPLHISVRREEESATSDSLLVLFLFCCFVSGAQRTRLGVFDSAEGRSGRDGGRRQRVVAGRCRQEQACEGRAQRGLAEGDRKEAELILEPSATSEQDQQR